MSTKTFFANRFYYYLITGFITKTFRVGKAAGAGVQLPEQESAAYRVEGETAQRARPQGKLAREHCSA
jgi:hypothetical protein